MKTALNRFTVAFVLGIIFACILFALAPWMSRAHAQSAAGYGYLHFEAGYCKPGDQASKGVIDTRNGNVWCLPSNGGPPTYQGTLNLAGIPARAPGR
jgi:hypothetical protein